MHDTGLPIASQDQPAAVSEREREIAELVHRFYANVQADAVLGPVFDRNVADWDAHLANMCDFWSSAVYRTGRYAGRPLEAHRRIAELRAAHFPRWLRLWTQTVDEVVRSDASAQLKDLATRMASSMSSRLGLLPDSAPEWGSAT
ncbi:MAG: group III truncated hemoglobin [Phycisphaerales bacterium JB054]